MNTNQQWITTNMRFPANLYMALKMEAISKQMSVTALVHQKLSPKKKHKQKSPLQIIQEVRKLAAGNKKYFTGKSLSDAVIEMRYEQ